ncbi:MAG: hypothetical protein DRJ56_03185 [Thermoprotei archaeon]|nr:MAG: hypothetical protein DRJ56_03185 [Thermoprotei archaeon]
MGELGLRFTKEEVRILLKLLEKPYFMRRLTSKYNVVYKMKVNNIVEIIECPLLKNRRLVVLTDRGREVAKMLRAVAEEALLDFEKQEV